MVDHRQVCKSAAVWSRPSSRWRLLPCSFAARSKSLVHLFVVVAHRHPQPEASSKVVAHSRRRDLRHGICAGRVFWGFPGNRGQSAFQHRRSSAQPVVGVIPVADFQLASRILRFAVGRWTALSAAALDFLQLPLLALVPQRREDARLQNFRLGSYPVLQLSPVRLSALVVKLARPQAYFSLQQSQHQFLSFPSSRNAVHL